MNLSAMCVCARVCACVYVFGCAGFHRGVRVDAELPVVRAGVPEALRPGSGRASSAAPRDVRGEQSNRDTPDPTQSAMPRTLPLKGIKCSVAGRGIIEVLRGLVCFFRAESKSHVCNLLTCGA